MEVEKLMSDYWTSSTGILKQGSPLKGIKKLGIQKISKRFFTIYVKISEFFRTVASSISKIS